MPSYKLHDLVCFNSAKSERKSTKVFFLNLFKVGNKDVKLIFGPFAVCIGQVFLKLFLCQTTCKQKVFAQIFPARFYFVSFTHCIGSESSLLCKMELFAVIVHGWTVIYLRKSSILDVWVYLFTGSGLKEKT